MHGCKAKNHSYAICNLICNSFLIGEIIDSEDVKSSLFQDCLTLS